MNILENLDKQQAIAAQHYTGKALIVAGAGSGKTTTLVRRLAFLIEKGIDPSNILLLTFTKKAAETIITRAKAFTKEAEHVNGGTFHSVAIRLIKENHKLFDLPRNFTIIDPEDSTDIIKHIVNALKDGETVLPKAAFFQKIISFSVNTQKTIGEAIEFQNSEYIPFTELFEHVKEKYIEYKKKYYMLDYDDLLLYWALLVEDENIGPLIRKRFPHVMIDEYQDSNALQLRIIYGIGKEYNESLVICGDFSQSLFSFRGSEPKTMFDFAKKYPDAKKYLLENNYRSTPSIVEIANVIEKRMKYRFDRKLIAVNDSDITPILNTVYNKPQEAKIVCDKIIEYVNNDISLENQAILIRSARNARHIEAELTARKIPYVFVGGIKLHETAHVKDFISVLKIGINIKDVQSWIRLLNNIPKIGNKTAMSLIENIVDFEDIKDVIAYINLQSMKKENLSKLLPILQSFEKDWLNCLENITNSMEEIFKEKYVEEWEWRKKDLISIIDMAKSYNNIETFIDNISLETSFDKKDNKSPDNDIKPLTISTIHSAKGLEWECIHIPSFINGHIPSTFVKTDEEREEEKRIFYVAVTRAKTYLDFYKPLYVWVGNSEISSEECPYEIYIEDYVDKKHHTVKKSNNYRIETNYKIKVR